MSSILDNKLRFDRASNAPNPLRHMLVGWGCGLLQGLGTLLPILGFVAVAAVGLATFGFANIDTTLWLTVPGIAGLAGIVCGPVLWARYLSGSWKTGLVRGALATFIGIIALVAAFGLWQLIPEDWWKNDYAQGLEGLLVGMYACCPALFLLMAGNRSVNYRSSGTVIGIVISLGLAFTSGVIWKGSVPDGFGNTLTLLLQVPPAVWATLAFFHSFDTLRSTFSKIWVWALLQGFTYGLLLAFQRM